VIGSCKQLRNEEIHNLYSSTLKLYCDAPSMYVHRSSEVHPMFIGNFERKR